MAAGNFTLYNSFAEKLGQKLIDLETGSFYMTLHTSSYSPSVSAHADYSDLTNELSTANGYTAGGLLLSTSWTRSGDVNTFTLSSAAVWNITGSSITAKTAVIHHAVSTGVNPLVGYFLLNSSGANATINAGSALSVTPNASGLFTITG